MFCRYCGQQIPEGGVCSCRQKKIQQPGSGPQQGSNPQGNTQRTGFQQSHSQGGYRQPVNGQPQNYRPPKKDHTVAIVLSIVGVVVLAVIIAVLVLFLRKKNASGEEQALRMESEEHILHDSEAFFDEHENIDVLGDAEETEDAYFARLMELKDSYENHDMDYAKVQNALDRIDKYDLSDSAYGLYLELYDQIKEDLTREMDALAGQGEFLSLYQTLREIKGDTDDDAYIDLLEDKYQNEFVQYIVEQTDRYIEQKEFDEAIDFLNEAEAYVYDQSMISHLLEEVAEHNHEDYVIADSDRRYLTKQELSGYTLREINYAKNEIYARHGRKFDSKELRDYFNSKSWYNGTVDPKNFNESVFNDYERKNIQLLRDEEFSRDSRGYQLDQ